MSFAASLYGFLAAHPGITAIAGQRIYPMLAPQRDPNEPLLPTLVFRLASRRDVPVLNGPLTLAETEWEFAALADDYDEAHSLMDAVIGALHYYKGAMGSHQVESCVLVDASDAEEADSGLFAVVMRFEIKYR